MLSLIQSEGFLFFVPLILPLTLEIKCPPYPYFSIAVFFFSFVASVLVFIVFLELYFFPLFYPLLSTIWSYFSASHSVWGATKEPEAWNRLLSQGRVYRYLLCWYHSFPLLTILFPSFSVSKPVNLATSLSVFFISPQNVLWPPVPFYYSFFKGILQLFGICGHFFFQQELGKININFMPSVQWYLKDLF